MTSNVPTVESSLRIHTVESSNGLPLTCVRSCPFSYGSCTFHGISLAGLVIHSFSLHFFGLFGPVVCFLFILKFDGRYHLCFHAHNSEFL
jgi:hypothetical protein